MLLLKALLVQVGKGLALSDIGVADLVIARVNWWISHLTGLAFVFVLSWDAWQKVLSWGTLGSALRFILNTSVLDLTIIHRLR